jgi:steroid delta-isomerase-like uncharacterized protein
MNADTEAVVRRWFEEVWNQRRADTIFELLTPTSVCYADDGMMVGPREFQDKLHTPFLAAFSELRVIIEAVMSDGNEAVVRWSATGLHSGVGLGFPPTGKSASFRGMTWFRIENGRLKEGWQSTNIPESLRTLATG